MICELLESQHKELIYIKDLIKSNDDESVKLGIGLLELYPFSMRAVVNSTHYSQKLGLILYQYNNTIDNYWDNLFWKERVIDFINRLLKNGKYYI